MAHMEVNDSHVVCDDSIVILTVSPAEKERFFVQSQSCFRDDASPRTNEKFKQKFRQLSVGFVLLAPLESFCTHLKFASCAYLIFDCMLEKFLDSSLAAIW